MKQSKRQATAKPVNTTKTEDAIRNIVDKLKAAKTKSQKDNILCSAISQILK